MLVLYSETCLNVSCREVLLQDTGPVTCLNVSCRVFWALLSALKDSDFKKGSGHHWTSPDPHWFSLDLAGPHQTVTGPHWAITGPSLDHHWSSLGLGSTS